MKKRFTILIAAIAAILMIAQSFSALGQTPATAVYKQTTFNSTNNSAGVSSYSASWSNTTSGFTVNITNANNNNNGWEYIKIGSSSAAYTGTITTNAVIDKPVYSVTINIGAITTDYVTSITLYTKTDSGSWSSAGTFTKSTGNQTVTISSPTANLYYKIEAVCTQAKKNGPLQINGITFNVQTFTVTYDCAGGTNGPTSPATAFIGSYTVGKAPTRDGYSFLGWNDGTNTYAAGASYTISSAVTFTAQWQSLSSPNIVINDGTPIALAKGASGAQTATVAYNNMSGYSSPSVALFNNSGCTESFTGGWFSASLSGEGSTTLNYSANANTVGERTVYIKVSATYNEATITSVLAATQATSTRTVTYNANGGSGSTTDSNSPYNYGATVNAVDNAFTAPDGKYFTNWSTTASGPGDSYDEGDEITDNITSDIELYARWADLPTYTLVTSVADIVPGAHYIIANSKTAGTAYSMGSQNTNYRNPKQITVKVEDKDGDGNNDTYIEASDVYEFVISGDGTNYWTVYDEEQATNHYLAATGGTSNNYLSVYGSVEGKTKWSISIDGTSKEATIVAQITGGTDARNHIRYNTSSGQERFSCYKSSNEFPKVYLYKKDGDNDCHIYSATTLSNGLTIVGDMNIHAGVVTVPSAKTLTVNGNLTNGTAANLVIEDGGQLITTTGASVKATVKKNITTWNDGSKTVAGWHAISSPVDGFNFTTGGNFVPGGEEHYTMYTYDEKNSMWINSQDENDHFNTLAKGQGYLYRKTNNTTVEIAGDLETSGFNYALSFSGDGSTKGFNLIGNPYTHNIYKGTGTAIPNTYLKNGFYYLTSAGGFTLGTDNEDPIAPGQSILVQVKDDAESPKVAFTNTPNADAGKTNQDNIVFKVANSQYEDVTCAMFDKGEGINKINHRNEDIPMIYIPQNGKNYALAMFSDFTEAFELSFKAATTGVYTLSYTSKGEFNYLHVIDRLTGADIDMLLDGEYKFIGTPSDTENRFIVRLAYMPDYSGGNNDIFAFQSGSEIYVSGEGELQIFDVTGRFVMSERINGATSISADALSKGVYVLRIVGSEIKTQKIVVR